MASRSLFFDLEFSDFNPFKGLIYQIAVVDSKGETLQNDYVKSDTCSAFLEKSNPGVCEKCKGSTLTECEAVKNFWDIARKNPKATFVGHGPSMDLSFLYYKADQCGVKTIPVNVNDSYMKGRKMGEPKCSLVAFHQKLTGKVEQNAHDAEADAKMTQEVWMKFEEHNPKGYYVRY